MAGFLPSSCQLLTWLLAVLVLFVAAIGQDGDGSFEVEYLGTSADIPVSGEQPAGQIFYFALPLSLSSGIGVLSPRVGCCMATTP